MRRVVISRPKVNPMQSGRARLSGWKISFVTPEGQYIDPLMGWTGSNNMLAELTLCFDVLEEVVAYVEAQGWAYVVEQAMPRPSSSQDVLKPKRYADNFLIQRLR